MSDRNLRRCHRHGARHAFQLPSNEVGRADDRREQHGLDQSELYVPNVVTAWIRKAIPKMMPVIETNRIVLTSGLAVAHFGADAAFFFFAMNITSSTLALSSANP